jgi:hypothetical protein
MASSATAWKAENIYVDRMAYGRPIYTLTGDGALTADWADFLSDADAEVNGLIQDINGAFEVSCGIQFGDDSQTATTTFSDATGQGLNFKRYLYYNSGMVDSLTYSDYYKVSAEGAASYNTSVTFGSLVGSNGGILGGAIRSLDPTNVPVAIDFDTDQAHISALNIYGVTFNGIRGAIDLGANSSFNYFSCTFVDSAQVDPNGACEIVNCFFIDTADADAALLWNENIDIENCQFIANTTGAAIEHPSAAGSPYTYTNMVFSGNTYDVYNSATALTVANEGTSNASTYEGSLVTFLSTKSVAIHVQDSSQTAIQNAQVAIDKQTQDQYTSASGNNQGDTDFVVTEALATDIMLAGWIDVFDVSANKQHSYRYSSVDTGTKTFSLRTKVSGTAEAGGSATLLVDTGIGAMDVAEGDTIRNETAGSWATVLKVETNQVTTTALSSGTWATGQTWSVHSLAVAYTTSDKVKTPIMNQDTDASGDASISFNYQGDRDIAIKVRKSASDDSPRYQGFSDTGQITVNGFTLTVTLKEQSLPI